MDEVTEFVHSKVMVKTYNGVSYQGVLLGIDPYLNVVLQDVLINSQVKKSSLFIKGSNVLYIGLNVN
ncbi:U6 snRNA-associated Sm-like protein LSm6 [Nematocida homosporus]|uniref:U6 snRNA-associated Sm-like protein LSm6 n=1 Tax=Nematocida homosporus TaxID=1912981 RepID=UPI00221E4F55|nr:U6 snRNA-associated Sm-like protein LSm6 [Nematocida homosporus]KAI5185765.1 U6 snRNA-associated Sm-like protein LSm6 [Nematocida homosporus]